jgi:hypothetical protein
MFQTKRQANKTSQATLTLTLTLTLALAVTLTLTLTLTLTHALTHALTLLPLLSLLSLTPYPLLLTGRCERNVRPLDVFRGVAMENAVTLALA